MTKKINITKLKMSDKLTIIIPTRNRRYSLRRLLMYYCDIGCKFELRIADSSNQKHLSQNKNSCENIGLQTTHTEYLDEIRLVDKINSSLRKVQTPYVAITADDDFISLVGLQSSIDFLSSNKLFSAVHGNFVSFSAKETKSGVQFDWSPSYTDSRTLSQPEPRKRLHAHHSDYTPTFYSVHRTSSIQEGFERAVTATDDVRFGELLPSMTAVINGKFKHLNVFYGARYSAQQTGSTADNFIDFIQAGTFTSKYDRYRDSLAGHLETRSELTYEESLTAVDDAMISYLVNSYGLSQQEAINLVKEGRAPEIKNSKDSKSLPVKVRDYLQTTPVPEQIISKLEEIYRYKNRYGNLLYSQGSEQTESRLMVDETEALKQVRQSVKSHPRALDE